ncbi:efflux RND transporter periplasmic adaptor subunit [Micromonospora sp. NPDC049559]|uniref:efflux RND transporter periplasmic adaptor subunit n=1 Tax=Micromonospora sp. NPDC049559 TaxID=3155923 RepID=UPI0034265416
MGIGLDWLRRIVGSRRARWIAVGAGALVVLLGSASAYALTGDRPAAPGRAATARVDRGEVALAVATTGTLRPGQTRSLGFGTSGTVTEVRVHPGDQVSAGQVLAVLDDADARDRVDSAQRAYDQARADRDAAERAGSAPSGSGRGSGGGRVAPVAAVARTPNGTVGTAPPGGPTPSTTAPATTTPTPGRPGTPGASASPSRTGTPGGGSGGPGRDAGGGGTGSGPGCAGAAGQSGGGTDPILRAQQRVNSTGLALDQAKQALAGTTITAPVAGRVLAVAGAVGSGVSPAGTFVTLGDVAAMAVSARFPEADAGRLATGLAATVTLPDRPDQEFPARVTQVDPVGTASGQMVTYGVLLDFDQVPADALVGQSANVRVTVQSVPDALRVPSSAVHGATGAAGTVLVPTAAGSERRQVTVGVRGDRYTEITAGLAEGDQVVANW